MEKTVFYSFFSQVIRHLIKTNRSTGSYFDKTQILCFLGRLLKTERKTFLNLMSLKSKSIVPENIVFLGERKLCSIFTSMCF